MVAPASVWTTTIPSSVNTAPSTSPGISLDHSITPVRGVTRTTPSSDRTSSVPSAEPRKLASPSRPSMTGVSGPSR